ncbi:MAG: hypothetical protein O3B24_00955 [Verrucomicrobia bacterium]|nr:hypothetical protein [Verrucomicrobiota bacterium]
MRQFRHAHTLRHLPWASKLVTTLFLLTMLAACVVTCLLAAITTGASRAQTAAHYQGTDTPDMEAYPKSTEEMLGTAHFHLFSMPVVLLIVGHLMGLTRYPRWLQGLLICSGFLGLALAVGMPFLVVHAAAPWAGLKVFGNLLMAITLPAMCVLALMDLYLPAPPPPPEPAKS